MESGSEASEDWAQVSDSEIESERSFNEEMRRDAGHRSYERSLHPKVKASQAERRLMLKRR